MHISCCTNQSHATIEPEVFAGNDSVCQAGVDDKDRGKGKEEGGDEK